MMRFHTLVLLCALPLVGHAQPPRLDAHGDALPDGALLRLGSTRLQAGGPIKAMAFTSDARHLVTANRATGVHVWEVATGKLLHHLTADHPDEAREEDPPRGGIFL